MQTHTFRLKPGQDLFDSIEELVSKQKIEAGCVLSAVGSLTHATLYLANRSTDNAYDGHFEIVSITGTLSVNGSHLHISISPGEGRTIGDRRSPGERMENLHYCGDGDRGF
jgi:uncharacterized protein